MTDTLHAALYSISPEDRETWVEVGMALKSELGEAGFALWDGWSRQSDRYKAADARAVWRSIKQRNGGITIGTLYHMAKEHGWTGEEPVRPQLDAEEKLRRAEQVAREEAETERRHREAVSFAEKVMVEAVFLTHPYLASKGFPDHQGLVTQQDYWRSGMDVPLVEKGSLIIPMRDAKTGALFSFQEIKVDGVKKNLAGGRAKDAVHRLGRGFVRWYCEGYATGLSIQAALRHLYRRDEVVVCFSDHNMSEMAKGGGYVVADHDESGAGQAAAFKTGLPYWMPPDVGTDANDFHQRHGVESLADALRGVMNGCTTT